MKQLESYRKHVLYAALLGSIENRYSSKDNAYSSYQNDPVGFGQDILGDDFTDDVKALMESVRDNPITIAKSANATGKTHSAARVAVWWFKCFSDSQVYTAKTPGSGLHS